MLCPYCNKEMKIGEIADKLGIGGKGNMRSPQLYTKEKNEIPLHCCKSFLVGIVGAKLPCYYCLDCRKILLDIPEEL